MWKLIPKKLIPPTRVARYCCSELKESSLANRMIATGVRWAESRKRNERQSFEAIGKNLKSGTFVSDEKMLLSDNEDTRRLFEQCQMKGKTVVNPIIDWNDSDIWGYIRAEHIEVNPLYKCGYCRVGCIGCPVAGKSRWKEFADYPKLKRAYIRAFDQMLDERKRRGVEDKWKNGEEVFLWWMEDENVKGQMNISDFIGEEP